MKSLNVLVACEFSQRVTQAFRDLGHKAYSCDTQVVRYWQRLDWHIPGDVTPYLSGETHFYTQDGRYHRVPGWDLIIAHPPCTYLCKIASTNLVKNGKVDEEDVIKIMQARQFFMLCLNAKTEHLAVENPLPMRRAALPPPSTYIDPSWYGAKYTKKTCLWLKNLPPLMAEKEYTGAKSFVQASRGKWRSVTFPGVAAAMAKQWSEYILSEKH